MAKKYMIGKELGKKCLILGSTALIVSMALAGTPPLSLLEPSTAQGLSRTFTHYVEAQWNEGGEVGGIGWFDPDDRENNCLVRIFGVPQVAHYYESLRMVPGLTNEYDISASLPELFAPTGCPLDTADDNANIGTTESFMKVGPGFVQSHILCVDVFATCAPDFDTAIWTLHVCNDVDGIGFDPGNLAGLAEGGSVAIISGCVNSDDYDVSLYLDPDTVGQSSRQLVSIDVLGTESDKTNRDSSYVISCYSVNYWISGGIETATSHDWFLLVKETDAETALVHHIGVGTGAPLQGLYDLSGDNGCPIPDHVDLDLWIGCTTRIREPRQDNTCIMPFRCDDSRVFGLPGAVKARAVANGAMFFQATLECGGADVTSCQMNIGTSGGNSDCINSDTLTAGKATCRIEGSPISTFSATAWTGTATCVITKV